MGRWVLGLSGALAAGQLARFAAPEYALDDAWISFRIARTFVQTGVPTLDPGAMPVEGMSNPLWTSLCAVFVALAPGVDPMGFARVLGGALWVAAIVVLAVAAGRHAAVTGGDRALGTGICAAVLAASGSGAFFALSGLETGSWALACALGIAGVGDVRQAPRRGAAQVGVAAVLLVLTRPEGLLLGGLLGTAAVALTRDSSAVRLAVLPWLGAVVVLTAVRLGVYDAWLPNTYWAKPPDLASGLHDAGGFVRNGLGGLGLLALVAVRGRPSALWLAGIAAVMVAATVWSGGDWMPGYRRFTFAYLAFAWLVAQAVASSHRWSRRLGVVALGACLGGNLYAAFARADCLRTNPTGMGALAGILDSSGARRVALVDIGQFGWHFSGQLVDLAALNDAELARRPGGHLEKWDPEWFDERAPDVALVFVDVPHQDTPPQPGDGARPRSKVEAALLEHLGTSLAYRREGAIQYAARTWIVVFRRIPAARA